MMTNTGHSLVTSKNLIRSASRASCGIVSAVLLLLSPLSAQAQSPYTAVAAGAVHACGLQSDGKASCEAVPFAQRYLPEDNGLTFTALSAGQSHTCGIVTDGSVFCWGDDAYNRLDVPPLELPVSAIDVGENHACAIDSTSTVTCWGLDSNERLTLLPEDAVFTAVSTRNAYSCAIDSAMLPVCSAAPTAFSNTQPPATITNVAQIEAYSDEIGRSNLACTIDVAGDIVCWGNTDAPQFDNGPYIDVAIGDSLACAVAQSGLLDCQAHNSYYGAQSALLPVVDDLDNFVAVDGGYFNQMCALDTEGDIVCWGSLYSNAPFSTGRDIAIPEGFSVSIYSASTIELKWQHEGSFGRTYEIYRDGELYVATGNGSSYVDLSLQPGIEYEYSLRAVSIDGQRSDFTNTVIVDTATFSNSGPIEGYEPPDRRYETTGLTADVYFEDTVELFWNRENSGRVQGYEIRKDGDYIGFTDGTSFTDESVSPGDVADYDVIAVADTGDMLGYASIEVQVGESECR